MTSDDDARLVARVLAGDKSAFGDLIESPSRWCGRFCSALVARADAEDVVQDGFIAAFLAIGNLRAPERFKSWLLGIVIIYAVRGSGSDAKDTSTTVMVGARSAASVSKMRRRQLSLFLKCASCTASYPRRSARCERNAGDCPSSLCRRAQLGEIAVLIEVPLGTVKARIHRARQRLRIALASENRTHLESRTEGRTSYDRSNDRRTSSFARPRMRRRSGSPRARITSSAFLRVILLKERSGDRVLPIWVGAGEGDIIAMLLANISAVRPTSWD